MNRKDFYASEVIDQLERTHQQVKLLVEEVAREKRDWAEIIWRAGAARYDNEVLIALYGAACAVVGKQALPQNIHDRMCIMTNYIREAIPALRGGNRAEIEPTLRALASYAP